MHVITIMRRVTSVQSNMFTCRKGKKKEENENFVPGGCWAMVHFFVSLNRLSQGTRAGALFQKQNIPYPALNLYNCFTKYQGSGFSIVISCECVVNSPPFIHHFGPTPPKPPTNATKPRLINSTLPFPPSFPLSLFATPFHLQTRLLSNSYHHLHFLSCYPSPSPLHLLSPAPGSPFFSLFVP
ncbi:hypothetical protein K457DRAFT_785942 [Linnemannia elongata AG-77]|uniref:Uncharacterized protein n=1 Tax=Linnemannia elongata AG-77 TaxID=1314771 RepID=A0A197JL69_9FUNG|nr:hypothetical protein K457DRAFT_785942 [Linnemannia elongata AG-77]